jgi:hypothetical protein
MDKFDPSGWTPPAGANSQDPSTADVRTPLDTYSITFRTEDLERLAQEQFALLGEFCLNNQITVLYAKPNTGKSLLILHAMCEAVTQKVIDGAKCYYVDADDNPAGILEKVTLLQPHGINVLAPGLQDFEAKRLPALLRMMAEDGTAKGCLVVIDTLKKFVNLMDKRESSEFANLCRTFIMAGGTIVSLAHTNKRTDPSGRPIYSGTSDIVDDVDCAYTIEEVPQAASRKDEKLVQLRNIKRRGGNPEELAYTYSVAPGQSYSELFASVRRQSDADLEQARAEAERETDADVIETIEDCIREGIRTKTGLKAEAAKRTRVGQNKVGNIIDRYAGDDPARHRWTYASGGHGKREYWLIGTQEEVDPNTIF